MKKIIISILLAGTLALWLMGCGENRTSSVTPEQEIVEAEQWKNEPEEVVELFPIRISSRECGYIDKTGKMVISPQFHRAFPFSEGLARVGVFGVGVGYINAKGTMVIEPKFDEASDFSGGLAAVSIWNRWTPWTLKGKWGYINKAGKYVIKPKFDAAWSFSKDRKSLAVVQLNGENVWINRRGEVVPAPSDDDNAWRKFSDVLIPTKLPNGKMGYLNKEYKMVIEAKFDRADYFCSESVLGRVEVGGKYGYIDKTGQYVVEPQFDYAEFVFSEGMAAVNIGGSWSGNTFDSKGKWGYVDTTGKIVIKPRFSSAGEFKNGLARIEVNGNMGYIDKTGKYIWKPTKPGGAGE